MLFQLLVILVPLFLIALNILLGWTVIGWVVALVWALTKDNPPPVASD